VPTFNVSRGDAATLQRVRRAPFDHPQFHGAVGLLDVDVQPRMRVHELDLADRALQF
jgi:hypothetical protein